MVNRGMSSFLKATSGLRQRNPLYLLLFIVVTEVLNKLLIRVRQLKLSRGLKVGVGKHANEVTHLFFADDIMLFCEPDERVMLNLRCVLMGSQDVSGLGTNFTKSELIRQGDERDTETGMGLGCKAVKLSIKD